MENQETQTNSQNVSTETVANNAEATQNNEAVDYQAKFVDLLAQVEPVLDKVSKLEEERDNYKNGMLAKDRKLKELKDQGYTVEDEQEKGLTLAQVEKLFEEKLSTIANIKQNSEVDSLKKIIAEQKVALVNRQGLASSATGNSTESQEVKPARWVDAKEVKESLIARGLNPDKVFENWKMTQDN